MGCYFISLKNDFVFAITHISDALPMMEREMVLEKSLPPSAEQVYRAELVAKATGKEDCGCPPDSVTTGAVRKDEEGVAKVDDLIYTEDDDMELVDEIDDLATDYKIPHTINSIASMFQIFYTNNKIFIRKKLQCCCL